MIEAILECCAGIDVGKRGVMACLTKGAATGQPPVEYRMFGTFTSDLEKIRQWLREAGCGHVLMESTG